MQQNRKVRPEILDSVALLVIDAQDSFIDTLNDKDEFKKRVAFAIEAARCLKLHTLFTEQAPEKMGRTNSDLLNLAYRPKVFSKQTFSALGAPGIERYLRDKEIYNLLIVGLEVPICLYQTGLQATEEDVDCTFLVDAVGSRRPQDQAATLVELSRMGCQVLPSETIFYSLLSDTQNPYFGPFTKIVKAFNAPDFTLESYLKDRPKLVDETPERPQKQPRSDRPQRSQRDYDEPEEEENDDDSETEQRPERSERRQDDRPERRDDNRRDDRRNDRNDDDSERRRGRNRGRRRGRGRRDEREGGSDSSSERSSDSRPERRESSDRPQQSERSERPERRHREERPRREERSPRPERNEKPEPKPQADSKPAAEPKPKAEPKPVAEKPAAAEKPPAKKAAKKAAKKVAKKAAKKAAKKVAKKAAKKPAAE